MFMLADFALYVAVIGALGEVGVGAVTTNLNINFLSKPEPRDLGCRRSPHPRWAGGWRSARSRYTRRGGTDMVAHATGTYALPNRRHRILCGIWYRN